MKQLILNNTSYEYLQKSFSQWLDILGYSESALKNYPVHLRELFHYLETQNINHINQIDKNKVKNFLKYLLTRPSQRGGALSSCSINHAITAINLFAKYTYLTGKYELDIHLKHLAEEVEQRTILTVAEVKELYQASYIVTRNGGVQYGQRDRAMLTVLYGCGLRKNEAVHLNVGDLLIEKQLLHVRKGKGRKQRLVPLTPASMDYLTSWLDQGRHWFLDNHASGTYQYLKGKPYPKKKHADTNAFFLSNQGKRLSASFYKRLELLKKRANISKQFSPHTLRHSIATHLMNAGMDIEEISRFLGHTSLASTQIYTHLTPQP